MTDAVIKITVDGGQLASDTIAKINDALKGTKGVTVEAGDAAGKAKDQFGGWGDILESVFGSFPARVAEGVLLRDMIHGVLDVVKDLVEALPEVALKGAAVAEVEENFRRLAGQAGQLGSTLLGTLRDGTRGTITDFELMKTANKDLAAGLNLTDAQFGTLSKGAFALAKATGGDVATALETMNDAMLTGRTRALALLTGKIDLKKAEEDFAATLGTTADHLSEEGKLEAARVAILKGVGDATERLGEQTDGLDERVAQIKATWGNFLENLGKTIATSPVVMAAMNGIGGAIQDAFGANQQRTIDEIVRGVERFALGSVDAAKLVVQAGGFIRQEWNALIVVLGDVALAGLYVDKVLIEIGNKVPGKAAELRGQLEANQAAIVKWSQAIAAAKAGEDDSASATQRYLKGLDGLKAGMVAAFDQSEKLRQITSDVGFVWGDGMPAAIGKGIAAIGSGIGATKASAEELRKAKTEVEQYAKAWQKNEDDIQKIWGEAFAAQAQVDKDSLAGQLALLEQKRKNEETAAAIKIGETTKSEDQLGQLVMAIQAKYAALEHDAALAAIKKIEDDKTAFSLKALEEMGAVEQKASQARFSADARAYADIGKLDAEFAAGVIDRSGTTTDAQIANVQRWAADEKLKYADMEEFVRTQYYEKIDAVAAQKTQAIIDRNDPIFQAWKTMNVDMRTEWAGTWEQALNGSISFGKAFIKTLEDALVAPFQRMLAAMLASWEQQLLGPMIGDAKGAMGAVGGIFGSSGSSGGGVNVSGLLGRGVGGANAPAGMVGGGTGSFDASGNWIPTSHGLTGGMFAGAGIAGGVTGALAVANGASTGSALGQVAVTAGMTAATTALTTGSIAATAAIGAMTFGVGAAAIGVALLIKHFMGVSDAEKQARASFGDFQGQFKNLDGSAMNLSQTIDSIGQAYDYVGKTGTEAQADIKKALDATHQSADAEKAALVPINAVLQQAADKAKNVDAGFTAIMTAAQAAGGHIPASLQPAIAKLLEMKGLTDEQKAALQALGPAAAPTFDELTSTANKYGITLEGLGPKFEQANIEGRAKGIFDDFSALTSAGADVGGVLSGMSDEISGLVDDSINFGTKIPDNMKPLIANLIDAGRLTDDQGKKITDISKISFEDTPVDKAFADLTKAVQDLTGYLTGTGGVTDAIDKTARAAAGIPDNPYKNWQLPPGPRIDTPDGASTGGWVTGSGIQHFASGGWAMGTDTVRALLTPGELVLNRSQQNNLAGRLAGGAAPVIIVVNGRGKSDDEIHADVLKKLPRAVLDNVGEIRSNLKRALGMPATTWT